MLFPILARCPAGSVVLRSLVIVILICLVGSTILFVDSPRARARERLPEAASHPAAPPIPFLAPTGSLLGGSELGAALLGGAKSVIAAFFGIASSSEPKSEIDPPIQSYDDYLSKIRTASAAPMTQPGATVDFDFDGDGKSDVGRWHSQTTEFRVRNSGGGSISNYTLGTTSAKPAPADYDGDGITDVATFEAGTWTIRKSSDGTTSTISFGQAGDIPVSCNFTGSGTDDNLAYFRPSNGRWYWREFTNATVTSTAYGVSSDIPIPGDYSGNGKCQPAVFRRGSQSYFWISGVGTYAWGVSIDIPVPGDYDADGKTDIAVYRPSTGVWWIRFSSTNFTTNVAGAWGIPGDQPLAGDFDGDGYADLAVFRPASGRFLILLSNYGNGTTSSSYSLGQNGDFAVPASYLVQTGSLISTDLISKARLAPRNATGGTNLYSQNFSWSQGLVGLPGRSGMDLNIGVGYNSLVWTKVGNAMLFDTDANTAISPGFSVGFPTIESAYYNDDTDTYDYLMVAPGGSRIGFRQIGAGNTYQTYDSSYARLTTTGASSPLDPVENITIQVTTADGTRMDYDWIGGAYRCTKIADRNGNYQTVVYDPYGNGVIQSVTDSLGRVVNFGYDAYANLTSISQAWKDSNGAGSNVTHTWATFTYATTSISTDFDTSVTVWGPPNGTSLKVLDKITYADGSSTKFYYNSYAQVWKVEDIAADSSTHVLSRVRTNLETPSADQTDCPRFTETRQWVENFNQDQNGTEQEVVFNNSAPASGTYSLPGSLSGSASVVDVWMTGHPDNLRTKIYYGASGATKGLTLATEDCLTTTSTCTDRKRWTWTDWTDDNAGTSATYVANPRVEETRVGDTSNVKRTTIKYLDVTGTNPVATYGLVSEVDVYASDLSTIIKKATTEYNLGSNYTARNILGLPSKTEAWGWNDLTSSLEYVSKVTYAYDEGDFSDSGLQQNISPVQHDNTNYGSGFAYRGNLTSTTRWDVNYPTSSSAAVTSSVKYNTAGSVVSQTTPWDGTNTRTVRIGYADNFNSSPGGSTYAYPTVMTDPAGTSLGDATHSSTVKYRYDIGANVEAVSPAPAGQTYGKTTKRVFDSVGRLERNSVYVDTTEKSYVRYEFPTNGVQTKVYAPLVDVDGDGNIAEDEVYTESWLDGAGRVRRARTEHPGSTGGWASTLTEYDILGRVSRQSVPTETDASYNPAGDDATRGFLWTAADYDWKGRTIRKINTDGDPSLSNDSDILISYEGCGCAGGQVTTIQSENVLRDDVASTYARRTQKIYEDILGRSFKTVVYKWDGTTAYTTTEQFFNGRDQVVKTVQTDNTSTATPQTHQDVLMSYDGHGRMATRHYPIEDALTETTWSYNPDDSVAHVTDPRGVITDLTYDARGLTTQVAYTPSTGIPDTPTVTYSYDNLGNRTSMDTAGVSQTTYAFDSLSRVTSETVDFDDLASNYTIGYTYDLSGGLRSLTEPFGEAFDYTPDKSGRLASMGGTSFAENTTGGYLADIKYRAFGGIKQMEYQTTDNALVSMQYDNRLRISQSQVATTANGSGYFLKASYAYNADSQVSEVNNDLNDVLDQWFEYDFAGRLKSNRFGTTLNQQSQEISPYSQTIEYDGFSNMTSRETYTWESPASFTRTMTNGRLDAYTGETLNYDEAGNILYQGVDSDKYQDSTFDAAGRKAAFDEKWQHGGPVSGTPLVKYHGTTELYYDGDGRMVREEKETQYYSNGAWQTPYNESEHLIYSTVLGAVLTSIENKVNGDWHITKIFAGGAVIGEQKKLSGGAGTEYIKYFHADPITGSRREVTQTGSPTGNYSEDYEALGQKINATPPFEEDPPPNPLPILNTSEFPEWQCAVATATGQTFYEMPTHCQQAYHQEQWQVRFVQKEGNPLGLIDSPLDPIPGTSNSDGDMSYAQASMSFALRSSKKDDGQHCPKGTKPMKDAEGKTQCVGVGVTEVDVTSKDVDYEPIEIDTSFEEYLGKAVNFANLVSKRLTLVGFTESQSREILRAELWMLMWKPCVDAFRSANLPTPAEVLRDRGVLFIEYGALAAPLDKELAKIGWNEERRAAARGYANMRALSGIGGFTFDPNTAINALLPATTILFNSSFNAGSDFQFNETMPHEQIHRSGVGKKYAWYQYVLPFIGHDLTGFPQYSAIVSNCGIPKEL